MISRYYGGLEQLGDRDVAVIASTSGLGRDGHIVEPAGIDLTNYRRNPIVLFSHQPESPVGVATAVGVAGDSLAARIAFAPPGVSQLADECCALVKSGVLKGVSIG